MSNQEREGLVDDLVLDTFSSLAADIDAWEQFDAHPEDDHDEQYDAEDDDEEDEEDESRIVLIFSGSF